MNRFAKAWNVFRNPDLVPNRSELSAVKYYGNSYDYWLGSGGLNSNGDFTPSEVGVAQIYSLLSGANAAINKWQSWVGGQAWELKDKRTHEVIYSSLDTDLSDNARIPNFALAVRDYERYAKRNLFSACVFSDKLYAETYILFKSNMTRRDTLQWLNPIAIYPQITDGVIQYYQYSGQDMQRMGSQFSREDVSYSIYSYHATNDLRGYPVLMSVITSANIERDVKRAFLNYFRNGMILGGLISPLTGDVPLMPDQTRTLEDSLQRTMRGVTNAYKWIVAPKNMNVTQFSQPDTEKNWVVIKPIRDEIMMVLDMPPQVAGDPSSATYDNAEAVESGWLRNSAVPYLRNLASTFNTDVIERFDRDVYLEFVTRQYETEDPDTVSKDLNASIIPITIAQAKRGYEVDPELEDIYMVNNMPMSKAILLQVANSLPPAYQTVQAPTLPAPEAPQPPRTPVPSVDTTEEAEAISQEPMPDDATKAHNHDHHHSAEIGTMVEDTHYTPELAYQELVSWQKHVKAGKTRPFEPKYLRGDYADTLQDALATHDQDAIKSAFDSVFSTLKKNNLADLQADFVDFCLAILNNDEQRAMKDIGAIRLDFELRFDDVLVAIRDGSIDNRRRAGTILRSMIRMFGARAYRQGMVDGGVLDAPSEEDQLAIDNLVAAQSAYVSGLTQVLIKGDGITDAQARDKAAMWWNKSLEPAYQAGLLSANANGLYEWAYFPENIHCSDCLRLNGQRHRLKHWHAKYMPQGDNLECKGFMCKCKLVRVTGRARGKF